MTYYAEMLNIFTARMGYKIISRFSRYFYGLSV